MVDFAIIGWLAIGLAVGIVSKLLYPGRAAGDWPVTIIVSVAGAMLDGWGSLHLAGPNHVDAMAGWISALVGAVI